MQDSYIYYATISHRTTFPHGVIPGHEEGDSKHMQHRPLSVHRGLGRAEHIAGNKFSSWFTSSRSEDRG